MNQQTNTSGKHGNLRESAGNVLYVSVPEQKWEKIESAVIQSEDLIDEVQVQREFHISKKTLCNYVSSGKIPRSFYTVCFNGTKMFFNKKLLGLEK